MAHLVPPGLLLLLHPPPCSRAPPRRHLPPASVAVRSLRRRARGAYRATSRVHRPSRASSPAPPRATPTPARPPRPSPAAWSRRERALILDTRYGHKAAALEPSASGYTNAPSAAGVDPANVRILTGAVGCSR